MLLAILPFFRATATISILLDYMFLWWKMMIHPNILHCECSRTRYLCIYACVTATAW